jgi:hypothetical protein
MIASQGLAFPVPHLNDCSTLTLPNWLKIIIVSGTLNKGFVEKYSFYILRFANPVFSVSLITYKYYSRILILIV